MSREHCSVDKVRIPDRNISHFTWYPPFTSDLIVLWLEKLSSAAYSACLMWYCWCLGHNDILFVHAMHVCSHLFSAQTPFFFLRFFSCVSVCVNPVRLIQIRKQADAINWDLSADCRPFWISRYSLICQIFSENHNLQHKIQTQNGMTCSMCMSFVVIYIF